MHEQIGDAPIEPFYVNILNALGRGIDDLLNGKIKSKAKKNGFILLVFPFEDHERRCNYISNVERDAVVVLLKEQLARFEGYAETKGRA